MPDGDYAAVVDRLLPGRPVRPDRRSRRAASSAVTTACTTSRSASGRAWASRPREPLYVVRLDAGAAAGDGRPAGGGRAATADGVRRELDRRDGRRAGRCARQAQIRHRHAAARHDDRADRRSTASRVEFDTPQTAVTPGQAVVFYRRRRSARRRLDRLGTASGPTLAPHDLRWTFSPDVRTGRTDAVGMPRRRGSARRRVRPCSPSRRR